MLVTQLERKYELNRLLSLLLTILVSGCVSEPSSSSNNDFELPMNSFNIAGLNSIKKTQIPVYTDGDQPPEWIDSWTADGSNLIWYTPQVYDFAEGDTIQCCVFYHHGNFWNCILTNAFYFCGESNWRNYLLTDKTDFGVLPPGPDAWLVGVGYTAPEFSIEIDWASKIQLSGYQLHGGIPLSGRPNCFKINKEN